MFSHHCFQVALKHLFWVLIQLCPDDQPEKSDSSSCLNSCQFRTAELPAHGNNGIPENCSSFDIQKHISFFLNFRQSYYGGFEICSETTCSDFLRTQQCSFFDLGSWLINQTKKCFLFFFTERVTKIKYFTTQIL